MQDVIWNKLQVQISSLRQTSKTLCKISLQKVVKEKMQQLPYNSSIKCTNDLNELQIQHENLSFEMHWIKIGKKSFHVQHELSQSK